MKATTAQGARPEERQLVDPDRELWLAIRRALLAVVAAIERRYGQ